jgi:hypothetical protein
MNLGELKNDFGSMINQTDSSGDFVAGFVSEDESERWLNQSFQEVYKWYATANIGRFGITGYFNTVADQAIYTFGGDATDYLSIAWLGMKYNSTDDDYTRAEKLNKADAYDTGHEKWTQTSPAYFERQLYNTSSTHYELGVEFPEECVPDESVTRGGKIIYIERPPKMSDDTDVPEKLPSELHQHIVTGAGIPAFRKMQEFDTMERLTAMFDRAMTSFMIQEQSLTSEKTKRIKMPKNDRAKFYRYDR